MTKGDLISRSALLEEFRWLASEANIMRAAEYDEIIDRIKKAPAVAAEQMEPARWEWGRLFGEWGIFCSNCGAGWQSGNGCDVVALAENHKYCPKCGKPMTFDEEGDWTPQEGEEKYGYCPVCDKSVVVVSNESMGHCPYCNHHIVLHGEEEPKDV